MKNKIRLCLLLIICSMKGFSQDGGSYDPYLVNPSLGGYREALKIGSIYQTQMTAYDNNPKSFLIFGSSPFNSQRLAGGFKMSSKQAGVLRDLSGELSFIYRISIGESKLSFGLSGTVNQSSLIRDKVKVIDPNDPILSGSENGEWFSSNVGVSFSKVNHYYVGLSVYNLIPKKTNWDVNTFENKDAMLFNFSGMYTFSFFENRLLWELFGNVDSRKPENVKYLDYSLSSKTLFLNAFWLEIGYANESTFEGGAGIIIQNLSFGYKGSYSISSVSKHNYPFTKHEIALILRIPYSKPSK